MVTKKIASKKNEVNDETTLIKIRIMEKENKYNNALEKLQEALAPKDGREISGLTRACIEEIFPELKESEDEKIRKEIVRFIQMEVEDEIVGNKWLAWLEKQSEPSDKGEISDGFHTFNELYYYRMLYNAAFFNMLPKEWVHKSKKHNDGEECFGGGWFIVMANLPTGQISNHYELKDWDLFQIPEKERADKWDGHTPQEAAERLHNFLLKKKGDLKPQGKSALEAWKEKKVDNRNKVEPNPAWSKEDEQIRKEIVRFIQMEVEDEIVGNKWIAWLEKQQSVEEIVARCKDSWYNEGKIAGIAEGLTDDEKYQQGWHDALEKQNEQNPAWNNGYSNGYIQAVEKAVEWLENHNDYIDVKDGNVTYFDMRKCVVDFRKAMKGGEE